MLESAPGKKFFLAAAACLAVVLLARPVPAIEISGTLDPRYDPVSGAWVATLASAAAINAQTGTDVVLDIHLIRLPLIVAAREVMDIEVGLIPKEDYEAAAGPLSLFGRGVFMAAALTSPPVTANQENFLAAALDYAGQTDGANATPEFYYGDCVNATLRLRPDMLAPGGKATFTLGGQAPRTLRYGRASGPDDPVTEDYSRSLLVARVAVASPFSYDHVYLSAKAWHMPYGIRVKKAKTFDAAMVKTTSFAPGDAFLAQCIYKVMGEAGRSYPCTVQVKAFGKTWTKGPRMLTPGLYSETFGLALPYSARVGETEPVKLTVTLEDATVETDTLTTTITVAAP